ncbi:hypothetical protein Q9L58_009995 [Maublancomyces gigas]|uniref:Uncharacterized protein n=1 Tax=Discina gigas TaxID=1032678 RepID=A0ABR3G611_9PEZI
MLSKFFIHAAVLATSVLAVALPAPALTPVDMSSISNPISVCEQRGIDVRGPIPSDAKPTEGGFTFEADSDAAHWARAQIALASSPDLEKRAYANIGIGMFAQNLCNGQGAWFDNVQYDVQHVDHVNFYSVGISYRGLRNNEHLDFSRLSGSDWCGTYLYSAGFQTGVGCFNSQTINCFRLWQT